MSHGPSTFRVTDVKRAVQACQSAGLTIGRVEVDREGKIVIVPGQSETNRRRRRQRMRRTSGR